MPMDRLGSDHVGNPTNTFQHATIEGLFFCEVRAASITRV
jgi:hypothetical protein